MLGIIHSAPHGLFDDVGVKNSAILGFAHLRKYLLSFVVSSAEKSHKPIYLKVKKSNRAAVSVYKSFGFKIIKSKSGVYVMKRTCFS